MERGGGVTQHREVLKIESRGFKEHRALGTFDGRYTPSFHGFGPLAKTQDHLVWIKGFAHEPMVGVRCVKSLGTMVFSAQSY